MSRYLMPDPAEAEFYGLTADWVAYRMWWIRNVNQQDLPDVTEEPDLTSEEPS